MEESEILIEIAKNLSRKFQHKDKEYYEDWPVWPFTKLEPYQLRYLLHKEKEDEKSKVFSLGEAPF